MFAQPEVHAGAAVGGRPERVLSLCFVAPHAWPVLSGEGGVAVIGGAEVQQAILARLFASRGYRVSMICLDFGQAAHSIVDGVAVHRIFNMAAGLPVVRFVHPRLTSMWRALKAVDADIYYYRSAAMWVGVLAEFCRRYGRRLVYAGASDRDFDGDIGEQIRFARDRWLFRYGVEHADAVVVQNERQREACLRTYGREAAVIPSCYEPAASAQRDRSSPRDRILWVGTLHENKRPQILFEMAKRLAHRRFVMIGGPGPNQVFFDAMRAQAAQIPNLEFKGFLPLAETETWFDRAAVLVNTSLYEGMPNTFLQAWARAVPTVATVGVDCPFHKVFGGAEDGAREVESALGNRELGEACRRYYQRTHSSERVFARYDRVFRELAS